MSYNSVASARISNVKVLHKNEHLDESSEEDPPMEEWSSISDIANPFAMDTEKRKLFKKGLYDPGSGEVCAEYIVQSQSSVFRHPYYNYPSVLDPGIKDALLRPPPSPKPYKDDGVQYYLDICKETEIAPVRLIYEGLKKPEINLSYYCVPSSGIRALAMALEINKYVIKLNLTDNFLDLDACFHIANMIRNNATIKELNINGCRIGQKGLFVLGCAFVDNFGMNTLRLARNDLGDAGGQLLAEYMIGSRLTHIDISQNKFGIKATNALVESFSEYNNLITLDLSYNLLFSQVATSKLLRILANSSETLEELNLSFTGLEGEKVAEALAEITTIPTLKFLNLSNNRLGDDCAKHIIKNLPTSKLQTLDLSNNMFTPDGACTLLSIMLRAKVKLKNMYLDNVCVNRNFVQILKNVKRMKSRKSFVITYDKVLHDWIAIGEDPRRLILRRGAYMGACKKKDMIEFLLSLSYAAENLRAKELIVMAKDQKVPINDDWVAGLLKAFPGPIIDTDPSVNSAAMREYIRRLWPDKKLPEGWTPPIMIRVDVKRKKTAAKSNTTMGKGGKGAKKKK